MRVRNAKHLSIGLLHLVIIWEDNFHLQFLFSGGGAGWHWGSDLSHSVAGHPFLLFFWHGVEVREEGTWCGELAWLLRLLLDSERNQEVPLCPVTPDLLKCKLAFLTSLKGNCCSDLLPIFPTLTRLSGSCVWFMSRQSLTDCNHTKMPVPCSASLKELR